MNHLALYDVLHDYIPHAANNCPVCELIEHLESAESKIKRLEGENERLREIEKAARNHHHFLGERGPGCSLCNALQGTETERLRRRPDGSA